MPVKSLVRFRCVSNTWLRLLATETHFIDLHRHRSRNCTTIVAFPYTTINNDNDIFFYHGENLEKLTKIRIPSDEHSEKHVVHSICNGLICYTIVSDHRVCSSIHIWNPFTRDQICIPTPLLNYEEYTHKLFGFGFHEGTNEYKVFILEYGLAKCSYVLLYTLGTHSRRNVEQTYPWTIEHVFSRNILLSGALHWITLASDENMIVAFDMKDEVLREMKFPGGQPLSWFYLRLGVLGGLLSMLYLSRSEKDNIEIWVMKEYGVFGSWSKEFTIEPNLRHSCWTTLPHFHCLNNEEIIIKEGSFYDAAGVYLYNLKTNSIKCLEILLGHDSYDLYAYEGSLISPYHILSADRSHR